MKYFQSVLVVVLMLCVTITNAQYQKYIDKAEEKYESGDYSKARKQIEKLKKKATKSLGYNNPYNAIGLVKEAKINVGLGELVSVMQPLEEAVAMSESVNGTESAEHAFILMEAAQVLISYGNYRMAGEFIDTAEQGFESSGSMIEDIKANLDVQRAQVLSGKGFYRQAIKLVDNQTDYYLKRALSEEGSKNQQEERKEEFAEMMIVKANSLRHMGDYQSADSAFITNLQWVDDNLKKSHLLWSKNAFLNAKLLEENGLAIDAQAKLYEDAYIWAVRKYELSHNTVMTMQANLMRAYYQNGQNARLKITKADFKKSLKEFDRSSIFNLAEDKMDLTFDLADQDIKRIEDQVNKMLASPTIPEFHSERVELLELGKKVALFAGRHKNTEAYDKEILRIKEFLLGTEAPEYHLTKVKLANYYVDFTDKFTEAKAIYDESFHGIVEPEVTKGHVDYLEILNHLAKFYEETDNYEKASEILDDALLAARVKYDNQDIEYGKELEKIAGLQINIGEYEKATKNLEDAIRIMEDKKTADAKSYLASAFITKAKLLSIKGEYDEAEEHIYDSEDLRAQGSLTTDVAGLSYRDDLGGLYTNIGRYSDATELLTESLKDKTDQFGVTSRHLNQTLVLNARLNLIKGDYTEAEHQARKANTIAITIFGDNSSKIVPSMLQLADVYTTIGDYDKAESLLKNAIRIQKEKFGPEHVDVGKSTSKLALVYFYQDKPLTQIQTLFQEAEGIIGKKLGSNNPTYADILKNMAIANIASGNYSLAFTYLNQAENIWKKKIGKRNNINAATALVLKGDIYYKQRNYSEAEDYYEDAQKQYQRVFSETHPEYVKVQSKLSKTYFMQSRYKDSQDEMEEVLANYKNFIKEYFPALSEREKAKFWNTIKGDYEFYNTLIVSRNRNTRYIGELYNNALLTKALLLNSSIKVRQRIMNSNDEELINMYTKWVEDKELLTAALSMSTQDLAENGIDPNALANDVELLEKNISLKSELFSQSADSRQILWEDVKNSLGENEVAIEMVRFRVFDHVFTDSVMYALLYVKGDKRSEPKMILLANGDELENRYLKTYRNSIKFKIEDKYSYEKFWKPIQDEVGAVSTIYLSPDGVYNQINLEAIPTPDGRYVLDNSNILLISNTKDLFLNKIKTKVVADEQKALMFGNPDFYLKTQPGQPLASSGLTRSTAEVVTPLPGTKLEIEELDELLDRKGWSTEKYTEMQASETSIKEISNPRVFHVATHGFFKEAPKASNLDQEYNETAAYDNPLLKTGLLLSGAGDILNQTQFNYNVDNGILTAYEAMNLNLDKTDLVVLSACETGLGEVQAGEGVFGLQRAFLVAGARTIVMSLFKVSDEATQQLMVKFYRKWIETGNKRQAFIDAKKEIRNEYRDPIYWGPFVMIGLD
ncbi:Tetratricopeptide repeat-containing protein [Ekhidna lutea]|uniref:Tetratricopeptide repeat-containing protein n=1 Tax=Ekhidna lutea TaxID=447679 RepID=A0A239KDX4_EKHLU|nr:CHAT domain-containing protein [Ekhidna lutea]SNT15863.1 Tetratricopeptide repeat-containing protein [Ekhidna lutea]